MSWKSLLARLRGSRRRRLLEREMEEEIRFHLEMSTRRNLERGLPLQEARRLAALQFGGREGFKEEAREEQRAMFLENFIRDIGFSLRMLRRKPTLAIAVVLTMALGIGANTAVFSVVNGVLLRPLPLPHPEQIRYLGWNWPDGTSIEALSAFQFEFVASNCRSLQAVATYRAVELHVGEGGGALPLRGLRVSPGFLDVLGLEPAVGRNFDAAENDIGGPDVVLIGQGLWRSRFDAVADVAGKTVSIDGVPHQVIGVLPTDFRFPDLPEYAAFLLPLRLRANSQDQGHNYNVIARARPGVSELEIKEDLTSLSQTFQEQFPDLAGKQEGFRSMSYAEVFVGDLGETLWILLGAVTLVLLIASGNTATLLLVRATSRSREMAVRASLGAARSRLISQLLTEGLVLSLLASVFGLAASSWGVRALLALSPVPIPRADEIGIDYRVLLYTLAVTILTGLLFGLAAGVPALRTGLQSTLRESGRATGGSGGRARDLLVMAETAFAVVLLCGACLLIISFSKLISVDTGFQTDSQTIVRLGRLPPQYGQEEMRLQLEERLLERLQALPGVTRVAAASNFPLERGTNFPVDTPERPEQGMGDVELRSVTPGYLETLGIPLLGGRDFDSRDGKTGLPVAIVNEALARRFWPNESPLGKPLRIGFFRGSWLSPTLERQTLVIGVAANVREIGLQFEPKPTVLLPRTQFYNSGPAIMLRSERPAAVIPSLHEAIREIDSAIVPVVEPMGRLVSGAAARPRFRMILITVFAISALLLAAVGIYGVVAASVDQKTREIGLRIALGATRARVAASILGRCLRLLALGLLAGGLLSLGLGRFLAGMLYGTTTTDPWAFGMVIAILLAVGAVAGLIPARRAARLDPAGALRQD